MSNNHETKEESVFEQIFIVLSGLASVLVACVIASYLTFGYVEHLRNKRREHEFYQNPALAHSETVRLENFSIIFDVKCTLIPRQVYPSAYVRTQKDDNELLLPDSMTDDVRDRLGIPTCRMPGKYAALKIDWARLEKFHDQYFVLELHGKNLQGEPLHLHFPPPNMQEKAVAYGKIPTGLAAVFEMALWLLLTFVIMIVLYFSLIVAVVIIAAILAKIYTKIKQWIR